MRFIRFITFSLLFAIPILGVAQDYSGWQIGLDIDRPLYAPFDSAFVEIGGMMYDSTKFRYIYRVENDSISGSVTIITGVADAAPPDDNSAVTYAKFAFHKLKVGYSPIIMSKYVDGILVEWTMDYTAFLQAYIDLEEGISPKNLYLILGQAQSP